MAINWNAINTGIQAASAYDNYNSNRQTGGQVRDVQEVTLLDASALMNDAYIQALGFLEAGNAEAAMSIIEGAKIASRHILEYGELSIDSQREFYKMADEKLQPFVDQGLFAMDEYASMLGIPNSKGELVNYDVADLRETPGYQFQFQEGQRAVETAAVGRVLGGRQAKEQMRYGDGLAQQYFGLRLNQLAPLLSQGANAASQQSTNAFNSGQNIGNTYTGIGNNLSNISLWEAGALAENSNAFGANAGNLTIANAETQGNLALGLGSANANLLVNNQDARSAAQEQFAGLFQNFANNQQNQQPQQTTQPKTSIFGSGSTTSGAGQYTPPAQNTDFLNRTSVTAPKRTSNAFSYDGGYY